MKKISIYVFFALTSLGAQTVTLAGSMESPGIRIIVDAIYTEAGIETIWADVPAKRALIMTNAGKYDGLGIQMATIEGDFSDLRRIPTALTATNIYAYAKDQSITLDNGASDLSKYKVGILRGSQIGLAVTKDMNPTIVNESKRLLLMMDANRIDIIVGSAINTDKLLKDEGYEDKIFRIDTILLKIPLVIYVHKKNADLIPRLDAAVEKLRSSGALRTLMIKHFQ